MDAVDAVTAAGAAQQHDDDDLSALELADGLLENVVRCPDCAKPVLPSALEDHAVTCQAIREGRPADAAASQSLKRRLSEVSNTASAQPPKKSKLVVHLSGTAPDKAKPPSGPLPPPPPPPPPPQAVAPTSTAPAEKKNKRIVDVDRQCGVINDKGYPCPRSLTCKTHNMSAKRAVPHRSHPFDILLFEWQKANKANQQRAEAAKMAQSSESATAGPAEAAAGGGGGANATSAASGLVTDPSTGGGVDAGPPKPKKRKSGMTALGGDGGSGSGGGGSSALTAASGFPKSASERRAKKGIVYVGEWEESDDDAADELVDSDDEVEATLRGLGRVERGRPLILQRGGGAGFAAASLWTGRNTKLNRLRDTLRDVFRPRA